MYFIKNHRNKIFAFIIIVAVTFGLRFFHLGENSFVADEFLDMNSSYGYAQTEKWQSWDFNYGTAATQNMNEARDERAVLYKHQVALVFQFLSPTEEHARLVSVLWGVVSVIALMFAAWFFTGSTKVALVTGALFSVAVSSIIFDRRLRMYAQFYPLYLLASVFIFATLERAYQGRIPLLQAAQKYTGYHFGYAFLALLFTTLSFLTHQLAGTLVFTVLVYLVVRAFIVWKKEKIINTVYTRSLAIIGALFAVATVTLPAFVTSFTAGLIWLDNHYGYLGHFWADFEHPLLGLVAVLFGALTLVGYYGKSKEALFLVLSSFVPLMLAIWFWRRNVGPQYIFMAQSFVLILAAVGVKGLAEILKDHLPDTWKQYAFGVAVAAMLILLPHYSYFTQEENTYRQPASGENTNYRKLFTVFNNERDSFEVLVTRNFRNYYFAGAQIPVYDFGGELSEEKLQKSELENLKQKYAHGAVVLSKNDFDYVSKEAETFLESDAFEKVSHSTIRGGNAMYRW